MSLEQNTWNYPSHGVTARLTKFKPQEGASEWHVALTIDNPLLSCHQQIANISEVLSLISCEHMLPTARPLLKRWYLSDAANQSALIPKEPLVATSVIEQPPLNGTKVALWAWFADGLEPTGFGALSHNGLTHRFTASQTVPGADSETATKWMLDHLSLSLEQRGASLANNCVRTWLFVRDVDRNYHGVVTGRNKAFETAGLRPSTHFIASTGIGGRTADSNALVAMDSYSVLGLQPGQMHFLYAKDYLSPTYDYGVAFERGTYIDYGDRRHVFISGTASINNRGEIVHPGDIAKQTDRMLTNVEALLGEAYCKWGDVAQMTVYLRDIADYALVRPIFDTRFPNVPHVIVLAPVCRPGWLIEMECMAVKEAKNTAFSEF